MAGDSQPSSLAIPYDLLPYPTTLLLVERLCLPRVEGK